MANGQIVYLKEKNRTGSYSDLFNTHAICIGLNMYLNITRKNHFRLVTRATGKKVISNDQININDVIVGNEL